MKEKKGEKTDDGNGNDKKLSSLLLSDKTLLTSVRIDPKKKRKPCTNLMTDDSVEKKNHTICYL